MSLRKFAIFLFCLNALVKVNAQEGKTDNKIVLLNDSIPVYGNRYKATTFSHSYFMSMQSFDVAFSNAAFTDLADKLKKKNVDISAFKAPDNKSIICVFPKHTLEGIKSIESFVLSNLESYLGSHLVSSKTVHIQVANEYDEKNTPEEKGFKGFTNTN